MDGPPECHIEGCTNDADHQTRYGPVCDYHYPEMEPDPPDENDAPGSEYYN